jgi:hypothetical protein
LVCVESCFLKFLFLFFVKKKKLKEQSIPIIFKLTTFINYILFVHFVFFNKNKIEKSSFSFSLLKIRCHVNIKKNFPKKTLECILSFLVYIYIYIVALRSLTTKNLLHSTFRLHYIGFEIKVIEIIIRRYSFVNRYICTGGMQINNKESHLVAANKKSFSFVFCSDSTLKTCHSKGN